MRIGILMLFAASAMATADGADLLSQQRGSQAWLIENIERNAVFAVNNIAKCESGLAHVQILSTSITYRVRGDTQGKCEVRIAVNGDRKVCYLAEGDRVSMANEMDVYRQDKVDLLLKGSVDVRLGLSGMPVLRSVLSSTSCKAS